jgi:hypothetical protein
MNCGYAERRAHLCRQVVAEVALQRHRNATMLQPFDQIQDSLQVGILVVVSEYNQFHLVVSYQLSVFLFCTSLNLHYF